MPAGSGPLGEGDARETAEEYRQRLARGKWLRRLPLFAEALQAGVITTAIVDALAAVLDFVEQPVVADVLADEDALLEVARTATRASFVRYLRLRVDTIRADGGAARLRRQIEDSFGVLGADDDLGMHQLFVKLDPPRGEQVFTAIRRRVDELQQSGEMSKLRRGQIVAQAICDLICGTPAAGAGRVEILVIADLVSLLRGLHDGSICETGDGLAIPLDVVRDLCRQAGATITTAVTDHNGVVVAVGHHTNEPPEPDHSHHDRPHGEPTPSASPDPTSADGANATDDIAALVTLALANASGDELGMGRRIRLANRPQRRALRAMYRSCAHPSCRVTFADCFIHHLTTWEDGGPTDLDQLLPLCGHHHHQIHDTGWRLTMDTARTLRWYRPDGTLDTVTPYEPLTATAARGSPPAAKPPPPAEQRFDDGRPLRLFDPPAA